MVVAEISVESSRNTSPLILLWTDRCLMYLPNPIFFWYASASASFCRRRRRRRSRHHCTGYRQRSQENLHLTVETMNLPHEPPNHSYPSHFHHGVAVPTVTYDGCSVLTWIVWWRNRTIGRRCHLVVVWFVVILKLETETHIHIQHPIHSRLNNQPI